MGKRYQPVYESDGGYSEWIAPKMDGWKMACCDCDLVHDFEFKVKDGQVMLRARRNSRSTAQRRRIRGAERLNKR